MVGSVSFLARGVIFSLILFISAHVMVGAEFGSFICVSPCFLCEVIRLDSSSLFEGRVVFMIGASGIADV